MEEGDKYLQELKKHPQILSILEKEEIDSISRLHSRWRTKNLLLKVKCKNKSYVFKRIHEESETSEIGRIRLLSEHYPNLFPTLHAFQQDAYLMSFAEGKTFFELEQSRKIEAMQLCATSLRDTWAKERHAKRDISKQAQSSFEKDRERARVYLEDQELQSIDYGAFENVPNQPSHNDMNAANIIYNGQIKLIDPAEKGPNDIARDIGRYCTSVVFNEYDCFGNNKENAIELAETFLSGFDEETLRRTNHYMGRSFLSFLRYETKTVPKSLLKKLCITTLTKNQPIIKTLETTL